MIFLFLLLLLLPIPARSEPADCITASQGVPEPARLFDGDGEGTQQLEADAVLTLFREGGIGGVYLIFDREYGSITLTDEADNTVTADSGGVLHWYVDLQPLFGRCPETVSLTFSSGQCSLNELTIIAPGPVPDDVQQWRQIPDGEAELMLFSTHGDDEQLFFAGLLPFYAGEQGRRVQVVYFTDHRNLTAHRVHEMLNGLWAVGVRDYPVFGPYDDYYTFDMADAYAHYEQSGHPRQELLSFVVEQLRRGRPLVAVGHDEAGEYGHGMHQMYTDLLKSAVESSADPEAFPASAQEYGTWDVPKTYLHLYPENPVEMNWDTPLDAFDGRTAYEVTKTKGFPAHASQQADFGWYFRGADRAADVEKYSPCRYGLYRTTVGPDTGAADFFENTNPAPPPEPEPTDPNPETPTQPPQPPEQPPQPNQSHTNRNWPLLPAIGTAILTLLTTTLSFPVQKEQEN